MRKFCVITMLVAVGSVAFGATFTDINSPQYEGKTGDKARNAAIDANFAAIEADTATVTLGSGKIWVGNNVSNKAAVAVSGDISLATNGAVSLSARSVAGEEIEAVAPGYLLVGSSTSNAEPVAVSGDVSLATNGSATVVGLGLTAGLDLPYVNKNANYTNALTDVVISYNTSAVTTNTLPEASTALGKVFCIALQDDDGDLVVMTDGTDKFDGTNDIITFADAGDSCWLMATAANVYTILVNVGGTLSN